MGKLVLRSNLFSFLILLPATGIEKIRQAYIEKEDGKKLKQKQRERMQPKMGKMDIDYQVLHDAFFKYQTKPKLTTHGDLYHEGKEFEVKLREMKPGSLSHELKEALGMPEGAPPPWLINMQRYGPPPSYPQLKIPGLNAPIPPGASFGYHAGGWGKPPVDEVSCFPSYVVNTGSQDKTAAKRVDLLRGQKTDRVDVTLLPEELEVMDNVLPSKYEEAREEEKLRSQREDFSDMVAENEKKRKRKMQEKDGKSKKKDFKF
ncbi:proline-rich spliceosome-associated (PSP) family protein [Salix suchowensis]|nr:proline-rich spliceosome-associated (PSP) family protein [Salix suchowensis]